MPLHAPVSAFVCSLAFTGQPRTCSGCLKCRNLKSAASSRPAASNAESTGEQTMAVLCQWPSVLHGAGEHVLSIHGSFICLLWTFMTTAPCGVCLQACHQCVVHVSAGDSPTSIAALHALASLAGADRRALHTAAISNDLSSAAFTQAPEEPSRSDPRDSSLCCHIIWSEDRHIQARDAPLSGRLRLPVVHQDCRCVCSTS